MKLSLTLPVGIINEQKAECVMAVVESEDEPWLKPCTTNALPGFSVPRPLPNKVASLVAQTSLCAGAR
jgi:hypothetical protein